MKDNWHKHAKVVFKGRNYYRDPRTGYYYHTVYETGAKQLLHRDIWEAKNKQQVPKGFVVHHRDHDKENNAASNLTCMERGEHQRHHVIDGEWAGSKAIVAQLAEAGKKAAEWHGSPEGLKWHSENGKKAWDNRKSVTVACTVCAKEYETFYPTRSKFCHQNCKATALRARRKQRI